MSSSLTNSDLTGLKAFNSYLVQFAYILKIRFNITKGKIIPRQLHKFYKGDQCGQLGHAASREAWLLCNYFCVCVFIIKMIPFYACL